jgi:glucokinase
VALFGGVDLGGTKIQAVVVDDDGWRVVGDARHETPKDDGPAGVARAIADALSEAAAKAGAEASQLAGAGVGSPGSVDAAAGTVAHAHNVAPGWEAAYPLARTVGERAGTTIALGNDVKAATEAELRLGAGRGASSMICVFWGTGVGAGVVLDGRQWLGRGAAGEIGHTVVRLGGRRCPCGRLGCLEAYAGRGAMEAEARRLHAEGAATGLFERMEKKGRTRLTSGIWKHAFEQRDELAMRLLDEAVAALAAAIASAVNLLDVERVVIGGGMGSKLGEPFVRRIEREAAPHLFVPERPPAMAPAELGDLGGALGAALVASARR